MCSWFVQQVCLGNGVLDQVKSSLCTTDHIHEGLPPRFLLLHFAGAKERTVRSLREVTIHAMRRPDLNLATGVARDIS